MFRTRALLHGIHHFGLGVFILAELSAPSFAQVDVYVDSAAGNNFNAGTLASPWKTVNCALTGQPAPLPAGSTIHLLGSSAPYGYLSGDRFPWVLYGGINLVAEPGGSGTDHIVDGNGMPTLIAIQSTDTFSACTISGLTLRNGGNGITLAPDFGVSQGVTIEECSFEGLNGDAVQINPAVGSSVTPIVRNNAFTGASFVYSNGLRCTIQGCTANGQFENNAFSSCAGLFVVGTPSAGATLVSGNTLAGTFGGLYFDSFNGPVEVTHNQMINTNMGFGGCTAWDATSRVEFNDFSGGGITISGSSNVVISDNTITGGGTGISTDGNSTLQRNAITGCSYSGISVLGSGVQVLDNVITGIPSAFSFALSINSDSATVVGNDVRDNAGVGILDSVCVGTLYSRNRITHNAGIGIQLLAQSTTTPPSILGDTIADNGGNGMVTSLPSSVAPYVTNCILWNNDGTGCDILGFGATQVSYCDIQKCGFPGPAFTNINTDPQFVDPVHGNYHLQPGSPCINTGDPTSASDCDGSVADMGALPTGACGAVAFCIGDGSGTACPCGNISTVGNNEGCLNSLGTGGKLVSSGNPSLMSDTVELQGTQMPSSSVLYFQGTGQVNGGNGAMFGDGLRCVGGSIVRLKTKANVGGASVYPDVGEPAISVKGLVTAPGVRNYQAWYRNAASFCTASTFNLTNGWQVTWTL